MRKDKWLVIFFLIAFFIGGIIGNPTISWQWTVVNTLLAIIALHIVIRKIGKFIEEKDKEDKNENKKIK